MHVKILRWVQRQNHDAANLWSKNSSRMKQAWALTPVTPWPSGNAHKRQTFMPQPVKTVPDFLLRMHFQLIFKEALSVPFEDPMHTVLSSAGPGIWGHFWQGFSKGKLAPLVVAVGYKWHKVQQNFCVSTHLPLPLSQRKELGGGFMLPNKLKGNVRISMNLWLCLYSSFQSSSNQSMKWRLRNGFFFSFSFWERR